MAQLTLEYSEEKDKDHTDPLETHRPRGFQRGRQYYGNLAKQQGGGSDVEE